MSKRIHFSGFTLVELIAIIVILAVLAIAASPRFISNESAELHIARNDIIMAFALAQQVAMAQGKAAVVLTSRSVDVQKWDEKSNVWQSIDWPGIDYPEEFPPRVDVTQGTRTWQFDDKLGTTQGGTITINNQLSITVEESGYAH